VVEKIDERLVGGNFTLLGCELANSRQAGARALKGRAKLVEQLTHAAQNVHAATDRVVTLAAIGRFQLEHEQSDLRGEASELFCARGMCDELCQDLLSKTDHSRIPRWQGQQAQQMPAFRQILLAAHRER